MFIIRLALFLITINIFYPTSDHAIIAVYTTFHMALLYGISADLCATCASYYILTTLFSDRLNEVGILRIIKLDVKL